MKIGSLYQVKNFQWLVFPSKETAARFDDGFFAAYDNEPSAPAYWSNRLNCNVSYIAPNSIFILLQQDEDLNKILTANGEIGWIVYAGEKKWFTAPFEEVKTE